MTQPPQVREMTVRGYAMWTAAGHDGPTSVAAMRAGASGAGGSRLWDRSTGDNLSVFRVKSHQWWEGATFLPRLIAPVILDCWAQIRQLGIADPGSVPILVDVAPRDRPGRSPDLEQIVLDELPGLLGRPWPPNSAVFSGGRVGLPYMLASRRRPAAPLLLVVSAESLLRQTIADYYLYKGRLLSGMNSSGLLLGEAAAAVLVSPGRHRGLVLTGFGRGNEESLDGGDGDTPVTGAGLTEAFRGALGAWGRPLHDIVVLIGDLNGEAFKFKELTYATMRLDRLPPENRSRRPREHLEHWNVAETIGEVGAAMMPAGMGWAFEAGRSGYLPGPVVFFAGEDNGDRVAITGEWCGG